MQRYEILEQLIIKHNCRFIAEIGVRQGNIPLYLFPRLTTIEKYYAVDVDDDVFHGDLEQYKPVFVSCIMTSEKASKVVQNNLDLVFIDADHSYESVKQDIELWAPKLKPKGILCGHDYATDAPGVIKAVDEIFGEKIHLEKELESSYIWWKVNNE